MPAYNPYINPYGNGYTVAPNYYQLGYYTAPQYQAYQGVQPMQMPVSAQPQSQENQAGVIHWIHNEKEIEETYVGPNGAAVFWHADEPLIYLKTVDATGKPAVKTFDIIERQPKKEEAAEMPETATKAELLQLASAVKQMNESLGILGKDLEVIKTDMYGVAGRKKSVKRADGEDNA